MGRWMEKEGGWMDGWIEKDGRKEENGWKDGWMEGGKDIDWVF